MIKQLTVENFQSHRQSTLEFAPEGQLTVIVGPSDSGKTAIIRAIKWLLFNRPQGQEFIRVGAREVKVTLTTAHESVARYRSSGVNRYYIDGLPLEGFGNDVPLEVQEVTGVSPTFVGDVPLNLNLAEQLDGPFLGSTISSGARARILGKLAGTEEVDHANKTLGTDIFRRGQDLRRAEERIEDLAHQLEQFRDLDALEALITQLNDILAEARENITRIQGLLKLKEQIAEAYIAKLSACFTLQKYEQLDDAVQAHQAAAETWMQARALEGIRQDIKTNQAALRLAEARLGSLVAIDEASNLVANVPLQRLQGLKFIDLALDEAYANRTRAIGVLARLENVLVAESVIRDLVKYQNRRRELGLIKAEIGGTGAREESLRGLVVVHENEIALKLGAYRDALVAAGRCPTCGSDVDPQKFKGVM